MEIRDGFTKTADLKDDSFFNDGNKYKITTRDGKKGTLTKKWGSSAYQLEGLDLNKLDTGSSDLSGAALLLLLLCGLD